MAFSSFSVQNPDSLYNFSWLVPVIILTASKRRSMFEGVPEQLSQTMKVYSNCGNIKDLHIVSKAFLHSLYLKEHKHEIKRVNFLIILFICFSHLQLL